MAVIALGVSLATLLALAALGWWSARAGSAAGGLREGRLVPCPAAPNCVCSEQARGDVHRIAPLVLPPGERAAQWRVVVGAVEAAGGRVATAGAGYLHATFASPVFGFVDDLELRLDADTLHWRSSSRVGYSDLGANRRRVDALRRRIAAALDAHRPL